MLTRKHQEIIELMTDLGYERIFITAILSCLDTNFSLDHMLDYLIKEAPLSEQQVIDFLNVIRA